MQFQFRHLIISIALGLTALGVVSCNTSRLVYPGSNMELPDAGYGYAGNAIAIRAEDGCHRYDYYFSDSDPNELLLVEAWETKQHQQIHIEQPHMARLRAIKDDYVASTVLREFVVKE